MPSHTALRVTMSEDISGNLRKTLGFLPSPPGFVLPSEMEP